MLEGLAAFHEGLVEHGIIERAGKKGVSREEILGRELGDMDRFLAETSGIVDPVKRELIENLTRYASAFYRLIEGEGVDVFEKVGGDLTKLYAWMDKEYYSKLEGLPDDMKRLVDYLNRIG